MMSSVEVRKACAAYRSDKTAQQPILNGLDMTVEPGSIYALIGASGCGKTTLLSCILGMKSLDSGSIIVLGQKVIFNEPSKVGHLIGFMPQNVALIPELTITETLNFFGNIFLMERDTLEERTKMIIDLLELPTDDFLIQNLSGGQKRRVSLAVAIIHNPLILILDEPTVGLDSLLREKIWNFLTKSTHGGSLSIIITTHYISEAQQSDRCGMMRDGVLLAEDSPANILLKYQARSLDEAFLNVCLTKSEAMKESACLPVLRSTNVTAHTAVAVEKMNDSVTKALSVKRKPKTQIIGALSKKEYLRSKRQLTEFIVIILLPVVNLIGFSYAVGGLPTGLKLGVVNSEMENQPACGFLKNQSNAFINDANECVFSHTSCRLLDELSSEGVIQVLYDTYDDAYRAARRGEIKGFIFIHRNMSEILGEILNTGNVDYYADISLDQSDLQLTTFLQSRLYRAYESFNRKLLRECERSEKLLSIPMNFNESFFGSIDSDFKVTMYPAFLLQIIIFPAMGFAALGIAQSRIDGVWDRIILAGVQPFEMFASKVFVVLAVQLIAFVEVIITSYLCLSIVVEGSILLFLFFTLAASVIGSFLGIVFSLVSEDFRAVTSSVFLFTLLMTNLSGLQWPVEGQPWLLQILSRSLPVTIPSFSIRNIIVKGSGLEDPTVCIGLLVNAAWIIVSLLAAYIGVKKKRFHNK